MDFVSSTKLVNDEVSPWNVDCKGDEVGSPIVSESSERACGRICGVVAARGGGGEEGEWQADKNAGGRSGVLFCFEALANFLFH